MNISEIVEYLNQTTHPEYQEDYDNSGFLVGDLRQQCSGVLVVLDLTEDVVDEAIERGCNLIVTHHPLIFGGLKRITPENSTGRLVIRLIKNNMAVYAAHTNLDNLASGVNAILAERLGLTECRILRPMAGVGNTNVGAGMVGTLCRAVPVADFLEQTKAALGLPIIRHSDICSKEVKTVAICGGSGAFLTEDAIGSKADIYLTGDLKYHDFQRAAGRITLADIGHFESENPSVELIYSIISKKFSTFACHKSERGRSFVNYI